MMNLRPQCWLLNVAPPRPIAVFLLYAMGGHAAVGAPAREMPGRPRVVKGDVQIDLDDVTAMGYLPLRELAQAVKRYPRISRFRVSYCKNVFSWHCADTALYDRRNETLKLHHIDYSGGHTKQRDTFYTKVTDAVLAKASANYRGGMDWVLLEDIPQYGAYLKASVPKVNQQAG